MGSRSQKSEVSVAEKFDVCEHEAQATSGEPSRVSGRVERTATRALTRLGSPKKTLDQVLIAVAVARRFYPLRRRHWASQGRAISPRAPLGASSRRTAVATYLLVGAARCQV